MRIVDLEPRGVSPHAQLSGQPPIIHGVWKTHAEAYANSGNVHGRPRHVDSPWPTTAARTSMRRATSAPRGTRSTGLPLRELHREGHLHRPPAHRAEGGGPAGGPSRRRWRSQGWPSPNGARLLFCTGPHARAFPKPAPMPPTIPASTSRPPSGWPGRHRPLRHRLDAPRPRRRRQRARLREACLKLDITHIESLCNLEALIGEGQFLFIGLPLKWRGGTGSPIRAVAVFDK